MVPPWASRLGTNPGQLTYLVIINSVAHINTVGCTGDHMDLNRPLRVRAWLWIVLSMLTFVLLMQLEAPGKLKWEVGTIGGMFVDFARGCIERPQVAPAILIFALLWFIPFAAVSALLGWVGQYVVGWMIDSLHSRSA